jgi:hypothetical protein
MPHSERSGHNREWGVPEEKTRNGILSTLTPLGEFGARILVPGGVCLLRILADSYLTI